MNAYSVIPAALLSLVMADNKKGRDKQADDEERRQRKREREEDVTVPTKPNRH